VKDTYTGQMLPFPEAVRVRQYAGEFVGGTATLRALDGTGNSEPLGGIDNYAYPGRPLMTLLGNELTIVVPPFDGGGYIPASPTCAGGDYWWEVFDKTVERRGLVISEFDHVFELCGTWAGIVQESGRIEGTISGSFGYYIGRLQNWTTDLFCRATDHHFAMVKR
jgi:hypothetical protein